MLETWDQPKDYLLDLEDMVSRLSRYKCWQQLLWTLRKCLFSHVVLIWKIRFQRQLLLSHSRWISDMPSCPSSLSHLYNNESNPNPQCLPRWAAENSSSTPQPLCDQVAASAIRVSAASWATMTRILSLGKHELTCGRGLSSCFDELSVSAAEHGSNG